MHLRKFLILAILVCTSHGCSDDPVVTCSSDSFYEDSLKQELAEEHRQDSIRDVKETFIKFSSQVDPLPLPFWLHTDTAQTMAQWHLNYSEQEALFPAGFEFPDHHQLGPFARSEYGETIVFWYYVWTWFPTEDRPDVYEVWGVTYIDSLAVAVHCFASNDMGEGYAIVKQDGMVKQVWWEQMEEINVSLSDIRIENGEFNEVAYVKETFTAGADGLKKSQKLRDDFTQDRYQWDD